MENSFLEEIKKQDKFYPSSIEPDVAVFLNSLIKMTRSEMVLELGTYKGFSTVFMADAIKSMGRGKVYTTDKVDNASKNIAKSGLSEYIEMRIGNDLEILKTLNLKFDLIFVDTSHTYEQTAAEFKLIKEMLNPQGIIVFHDSIRYEGVSRVIDYAKNIEKFETVTLKTPHMPERDSGISGLTIMNKT